MLKPAMVALSSWLDSSVPWTAASQAAALTAASGRAASAVAWPARARGRGVPGQLGVELLPASPGRGPPGRATGSSAARRPRPGPGPRCVPSSTPRSRSSRLASCRLVAARVRAQASCWSEPGSAPRSSGGGHGQERGSARHPVRGRGHVAFDRGGGVAEDVQQHADAGLGGPKRMHGVDVAAQPA